MEKKNSTTLKEYEEKGYTSQPRNVCTSPTNSPHHRSMACQRYIRKGSPSDLHIVAAIGSPSHLLSEELARIISPLAGKAPSHVRNSADFVQ